LNKENHKGTEKVQFNNAVLFLMFFSKKKTVDFDTGFANVIGVWTNCPLEQGEPQRHREE
jgi:hypothetical protein